jgi:uncharacterized membrane protein
VEYEPRSGLSKWVLATRGVTVDWQARNTLWEAGKRIAWETVEDVTPSRTRQRTRLPNRGDVTFTDTGVDRSQVRLAISFDAPAFVTVLVGERQPQPGLSSPLPDAFTCRRRALFCNCFERNHN